MVSVWIMFTDTVFLTCDFTAFQDLIESDLPKAVQLLNNLTEQVKTTKHAVINILRKLLLSLCGCTKEINLISLQVASVTSHVRELLTKAKDGAFKTSKVRVAPQVQSLQ